METDPNSDVLLTCRTAISDAGTALVERAQHAGDVRTDTNFTDIVRMVGGIAMVPTEDPEQKKRLLELALDGLRYHHTTTKVSALPMARWACYPQGSGKTAHRISLNDATSAQWPSAGQVTVLTPDSGGRVTSGRFMVPDANASAV